MQQLNNQGMELTIEHWLPSSLKWQPVKSVFSSHTLIILPSNPYKSLQVLINLNPNTIVTLF